MWPSHYKDRFESWHQLRLQCSSQTTHECLTAIDKWWSQTPWRPYYLNYTDYKIWPTPWELLSDNIYCDVARALGIVYTIVLISPPGIDKIVMAETDKGNLVLINQGKYILNWQVTRLLNIEPDNITIKTSLDSKEIIHLLG